MGYSLAEILKNKLLATDTLLFVTGKCATGKTTVVQELAKATSLPVIDVGLGYRLATLLKSCGDSFIPSKILFSTMSNNFILRTINGECRVLSASGEDWTPVLKGDDIDRLVGAVEPDDDRYIRDFLREAVKGPFLAAARNTALADARENVLQVNLECSLSTRVQRRALQSGRNNNVVRYELVRREKMSSRHFVSAPEAITINTSHLDVPQVVNKLMEIVNEILAR